ncbi:MAG: hypothetical protein ORN21_06735, partial [Methylophilaceae bacterium]|nr:hypothetical protein [Methylophilaceae bacterium]
IRTSVLDAIKKTNSAFAEQAVVAWVESRIETTEPINLAHLDYWINSIESNELGLVDFPNNLKGRVEKAVNDAVVKYIARLETTIQDAQPRQPLVLRSPDPPKILSSVEGILPKPLELNVNATHNSDLSVEFTEFMAKAVVVLAAEDNIDSFAPTRLIEATRVLMAGMRDEAAVQAQLSEFIEAYALQLGTRGELNSKITVSAEQLGQMIYDRAVAYAQEQGWDNPDFLHVEDLQAQLMVKGLLDNQQIIGSLKNLLTTPRENFAKDFTNFLAEVIVTRVDENGTRINAMTVDDLIAMANFIMTDTKFGLNSIQDVEWQRQELNRLIKRNNLALAGQKLNQEISVNAEALTNAIINRLTVESQLQNTPRPALNESELANRLDRLILYGPDIQRDISNGLIRYLKSSNAISQDPTDTGADLFGADRSAWLALKALDYDLDTALQQPPAEPDITGPLRPASPQEDPNAIVVAEETDQANA